MFTIVIVSNLAQLMYVLIIGVKVLNLYFFLSLALIYIFLNRYNMYNSDQSCSVIRNVKTYVGVVFQTIYYVCWQKKKKH
jgi:hypothetical protein